MTRIRTPQFDSWVRKIPWRRKLQYSGMENSVDYIVHGVTKCRTQLSDFHLTFHFSSDLIKAYPWLFSTTNMCHHLNNSREKFPNFRINFREKKISKEIEIISISGITTLVYISSCPSRVHKYYFSCGVSLIPPRVSYFSPEFFSFFLSFF